MHFDQTGCLYVSDMDGTLLQSDGTLCMETKRIIRKFIAGGGAFTLCTGRPTGLVLTIAAELGIRLPVLTYNGAMGFSLLEKRYIHHALIAQPTADLLIERTKSLGIDFVIYLLDASGRTVLVHDRPTHSVMARFVTDHVAYEHLLERYDPNMALQQGDRLVQVVAINDHAVLLQLRQDLLDHLAIKVFAVECMSDPGQWFLEATSMQSTKGKGVSWLREYLGAKKVVCFGDLLNDIPMFEVADIAVAMENAACALKEIAHEVTSSNDAYGVARFLADRYPLGPVHK